MKTTISFTEYDLLTERVSKNTFRAGNWWPEIEDIKEYVEPNISKYLEFLLWVLETADAPETEEQKASKKYINKLLINSLKFVENAPNSVKQALKLLQEQQSPEDSNEIYGD